MLRALDWEDNETVIYDGCPEPHLNEEVRVSDYVVVSGAMNRELPWVLDAEVGVCEELEMIGSSVIDVVHYKGLLDSSLRYLRSIWVVYAVPTSLTT